MVKKMGKTGMRVIEIWQSRILELIGDRAGRFLLELCTTLLFNATFGVYGVS